MRTEIKADQPESERHASKSKYDSAWKKVIQHLFEAFLAFFSPQLHRVIDFSRKITFLDKELLEISQDSLLGDRVADILARVYLKPEFDNGSAQILRIITHIEVQGKGLLQFMERMFIYYYRTFDREKGKRTRIVSLAILTDSDPAFRPSDYGYEFCGFKILMQIPVVKILDYRYDPVLIEKLETSDNPMALVVKAQLKSMDLKGADSEKRFEALKELIRLCYQKKFSQDYTRSILHFFALTIRLPEIYKESIKQVILKAEEESKMEYVPLWERDAWKGGVERGVERGVKKGILKVAKNLLQMGFDIPRIQEATGLKKEEIEKLCPTPANA